MNLLWVPHQTWLNRSGITRDKHLIENLKQRHEIHIIQHTQPYENNIPSFFKPKNMIESIKNWDYYDNGLYHHHIPHIYFTRIKPFLRINNRIFKKKIREIIKDYKIEVILCGISHYLHGYPPFDISIPVVFDYLDFLHDFDDPNKENKKILEEYLENAEKILCVSKTLLEDLEPIFQKKASYLPNGVDLEYYKSYNFNKTSKVKYISLIGLNISESLFYLDIFPKIKEKVENIKMILVGGGIRYPVINKYIKKNKDKSDFILTGFIPYENIRKYFFLTDVGLYPTLKNRYYDSACPLKVFEYTAAEKPIVSTDVKELNSLNFPNVYLAKPTTQDFLDKVIEALEYKGSYPDLKEFDWKNLSKNLEKLLKNI